MKCSTHSGLLLRQSKWLGKQRFPPIQRVGKAVTREGSGLRKALELSHQQPEIKDNGEQPEKSGRKHFRLGLYPSKPSTGYLLKSASQWGLSWPPYSLFQHPFPQTVHSPILGSFSVFEHFSLYSWCLNNAELGADPYTVENLSITFDSPKV